jgi:hypothetical protein
MYYNPEGCQKVAGGRSEAKTSGRWLIDSHPEGVPARALAEPERLAPFRVLTTIGSRSGGLRPPATILQPSGLRTLKRARKYDSICRRS